MIVFIPCSGPECKPSEEGSEWLPRQCPSCGQLAVIGHGRRFRPAHDRLHDSIRVRRGHCRHCGCTVTVLPAWCVPRARYSLAARQEAMDLLASGLPVEQAAPECRDADRVADASTIRRWAWRRLESLAAWAALAARWLAPPTLFAWDWRALLPMLVARPAPP